LSGLSTIVSDLSVKSVSHTIDIKSVHSISVKVKMASREIYTQPAKADDRTAVVLLCRKIAVATPDAVHLDFRKSGLRIHRIG